MSKKRLCVSALFLCAGFFLYCSDLVSTYGLCYDGNGSVSGIAPLVVERYAAGAAVTVADNFGNLSRPGYLFIGWNTKADGTGLYLAPGSSCAIEGPDTVLYAQWADEALVKGGSVGNFEASVKKLEALPAPEEGTIAAVGSSTMVYWPCIAADLGLPIWNRAFGGSTTAEQLPALARLVLPHRPRLVIYYCGDNDIAAPHPNPALPVENFILYAEALHRALPNARIVYLTIKPSIARWTEWKYAEQVNAAITAWSFYHPFVTVVSTKAPLLGESGFPKAELYKPDRLHLNAAGYKALAESIGPAVQRVWAAAQQ
jgi:lysophospholipase L1-like esterase